MLSRRLFDPNYLNPVFHGIFSPALFLGLGLVGVPLFTLTPWLAKRFGANRMQATLALLLLLPIILITLPILSPSALLDLPAIWSSSRAIHWIQHEWVDVALFNMGLEGWANVVLYIPAAYAWSKLTRHPWLVMAAFWAFSYLTETLQAGLLVRIADPRDLYANCLGAMIGVAAATASGNLRAATASTESFQWRALLVGSAVFAVFLIFAEIGLNKLADREQGRLNAALKTTYGKSTLNDVLSAAAADEYTNFSTKAGVNADYLGLTTSSTAQARYSIPSTAHPRCVILTWQADQPVVLTDQSGETCLEPKQIGLPSPADAAP